MYKTDMEDQELLQEEFNKRIEAVRALSLEEMLEKLVKAHDSTDVILEGYNLVTNVNEGHGIALAGIIRLRDALAEMMDWVDHNLFDEVEEVDSEEL